MRFLVDECTGHAVAAWLRSLQLELVSGDDEARGLDDESVIKKANFGNYILVTNDKDFGELVFRTKRPHNPSYRPVFTTRPGPAHHRQAHSTSSGP